MAVQIARFAVLPVVKAHKVLTPNCIHSCRTLMLSFNIKTNDQLMTTRLCGLPVPLSTVQLHASTSQLPLDVDKLIVEPEEAQ